LNKLILALLRLFVYTKTVDVLAPQLNCGAYRHLIAQAKNFWELSRELTALKRKQQYQFSRDE
jgi:hypothetical protein